MSRWCLSLRIRRCTALMVTALASLGLLGLTAAPAGAAVTVGSSLPQGDATQFCEFPGDPATTCTFVQTSLPGHQLTAPFDGVIVRWRLRQDNFVEDYGEVRLRVLRRDSGATFTALRSSETVNLPGVSAPTIHRFDTRVPVAAGEFIGIDLLENCCVDAVITTDPVLRWDPALADGEQRAGLDQTGELLFNADIEPDCDSDGFGDETQDADTQSCNPPQPSFDGAPDTQITQAPEGKVRSKSATIAFSGSDARAVVRFECRLDDGAFETCTSPKAYSGLKKGSHTVQVRAIDDAGNVDPTPATRSWRVKKKKRKKDG